MPVVALTQGMGSLAQDIAEQLAHELNLTTLQHEVAEHVAQKMHVSKSLISRLRSGKAGTIERLRADQHAIAVFTAEDVLEAAARGNVVIRGWGATQILRAVPHIPCIRVMRPFEKRVEWLMKELDTDDRDLAEKEIRRSDHANAVRMHDQFGVHWGDPVLFDLVLNTDRLSVATCVEMIKDLFKRPEFAETDASRSLLQGMALSAHVRAALSSHEETHAVDVTIESVDGRVTLSGMVADGAERQAAERVTAGVAGVKSVDNRLHAITDAKHFPTARR
ncbi:MAG TPA: cytidylate kinase family protein [Burkholderiaceae bacterium]|nr:cytidylate kinase family protein [Burkholderiaceae bacterium]